MKKTAVLLLFILVGISCSNDSTSTTTTQSVVVDAVTTGTWRVSLYNDSGSVKTYLYTSYDFKFGSDGILTANSSSDVSTGTWSVTDSNTSDDTLEDLDFNIAFATPVSFVDLTDDWSIVSQTTTKIELTSVSGGNGGTDYLTFEKN